MVAVLGPTCNLAFLTLLLDIVTIREAFKLVKNCQPPLTYGSCKHCELGNILSNLGPCVRIAYTLLDESD